MTKLLLFGNDVENDLYDWKVDGLKEMKCEIESFNKLIKSCNHPNITTSITVSLIQSITLYDIVKSSTIIRTELEEDIIIQDLIKDETGDNFFSLFNQRIEEDSKLINFLVQHGMTNNNQSIYSIALLSSIPPEILIQQIDSIKGIFTNELNIEDVIKSANQIIDHPTTVIDGLDAINNLKQLDKSDDRVVDTLVKFAQHYAFDDWRLNAVVALSQFPSK